MRKSNFNKLIVALDLENKNKIKKVIVSLTPQVKKFKLGLIAFTRFGPELIKLVKRRRAQVFLDLKFYDIPNTMSRAACLAAALGVWGFTVHLKSGKEALIKLRKELTAFCQRKKIKRPLIFGVTELTSKNVSLARVLALTKDAYSAKLDGVVCSGRESRFIKKKYKRLKIITPGIRKKYASGDDQKRTASADEAIKRGADYIVVGRPIIHARDYLKAAQDILGL